MSSIHTDLAQTRRIAEDRWELTWQVTEEDAENAKRVTIEIRVLTSRSHPGESMGRVEARCLEEALRVLNKEVRAGAPFRVDNPEA